MTERQLLAAAIAILALAAGAILIILARRRNLRRKGDPNLRIDLSRKGD